ncbi:hypothetical protein Ndes2526B_g09263 [Nannochloris sp. 'desiccata']|nr:hypothetical protein KSW81_003704 [Chlorella desiccata (nom. nud.)]KAH7615948.1 putative 30-kDa cleavage and polyadenylation specificity factor 30 [Chlorella desiccata (nom. nud.)]
MDADFEFDFEKTLEAQQPSTAEGASGNVNIGPGGRAEAKPRNYRQTVCTYWLRGLCMKGDTCGFLHEFNPEKMPVCRNLLKFGVCKEPDCPYKHTTEEIKECNMYKLGFCIYGPACRFKHTRQGGPPPDPEIFEACKPRELRNINIVANQANEGILPADQRRKPLRLGSAADGGGDTQLALPGGQVDNSLLAAVGQRDLRYGF